MIKKSNSKADLTAIRGEREGDRVLSAKEIGSRLIQLRENLSREEVASAVGVSVSAISMYENGERIPRDAVKIKLAEFYHKSVQEIFFDQECHI